MFSKHDFSAELNAKSHLLCSPNNTYNVLINGESDKTGSLLEDFEPSVNPSKEIDDPNDKKPEDWVEEKTIADPDAKKVSLFSSQSEMSSLMIS